MATSSSELNGRTPFIFAVPPDTKLLMTPPELYLVSIIWVCGLLTSMESWLHSNLAAQPFVQPKLICSKDLVT